MEDKTTADWEWEKKIIDSGSIDRNRLEDTRIHPIGNQMLAGNWMVLDEPARFEQGTKPTEEDPDSRTEQDLEDSPPIIIASLPKIRVLPLEDICTCMKELLFSSSAQFHASHTTFTLVACPSR